MGNMNISNDKVEIALYRDKKNYMIYPYSCRSANGLMVAFRLFAKLRCGCSVEALGEEMLLCVEYAKQHPTHEFEEETNVKTSWKNTERLSFERNLDGSYLITVCFRDLRCNTWDYADEINLPAGASAVQIGEAIVEGFRICDMYAARSQFMMYLSEKEGLKIVPMAICTQGNYVMAEYCEHLEAPYDENEMRQAVKRIIEYTKQNPTDNRSNKERKTNQPWMSYSRFKSWRGFVKDNQAVEVIALSDGTYVISPTMRFDDYDCEYVSYNGFGTTFSDEDKLIKRIFKMFEVSKHLSESRGDKQDFKESYGSFFDRWLAQKGLPSWQISDDE